MEIINSDEFKSQVEKFTDTVINLIDVVAGKKDRQSFKENVERRILQRNALVKTLNKLESNPPESIPDLKYTIAKLQNIKVDIEDLDVQLDDVLYRLKVFNQTQYMENHDINTANADALGKATFSTKFRLETIMKEIPFEQEIESNKNNSKLHLPNVELPIFAGKPEDFERFIFSFKSIINKFSLTQFEKYSYLLQRVKGAAKDIVESVPTGQNEFDNAIQLLTDAFSDEVTQQFAVIQNLSNLKLQTKQECYHWISQARSINDQIKRLNITENTFLQYHLWHGMSNNFKKHFIDMSNKNMPDVDDILDNAFDVFKRMRLDKQESSSGISRDLEVVDHNMVSLATGVDYNVSTPQSKPSPVNSNSNKNEQPRNKKDCTLCTKDGVVSDHYLSKCPVYISPQQKIDKIKSLAGCTRCGMLNHANRTCKFRFKHKCYTCDRYHFNYLCTNKRDNPSNHNTNTVSFNVMNADNDSNVIIPSFTVNAKSRQNKTKHARCMYDPASQVTFVTQKFADKIKYDIVEKVNAKITGFNGPKYYDTNLIKFPIKIGNHSREIKGLIVPEIRSKIKSDLFKEIKTKFKDANIALADRNLGFDEEVDILVGADSVGIIPVHCCNFGPTGQQSIVYYCAAGIMLAGDMTLLVANLQHVHLLKEFIRKIDTL